MKHTKNILGTMLLTAMVVASTSCVDDSKLLFAVEKPASIAGREYLNEYDVLKSYVNSSANPDFKLGIALAANDYIGGGVVTRLTNSNFHEMTAGNAMKYASVVADNGTMNFETVDKFVTAAKAGGITIYGHTLAWHAQQNNKYLNNLIKDKEIDVDPNEKVDVEDYVVDYSKDPYTFWNSVAAGVTLGVNASEGCLEIVNPTPTEQNYFVQYHTADGIPTIKGQEYKLKMMIRGSDKGRLTFGIGPWDGRADGAFEFDTEWKEYEFAFKAVADGGHVMTQSGLFAGTLQIKYVKITHSEAPAISIFVNQLENSKMEVGGSMANFVVREKGKGDVPGTILEGQGPENMNCTKITSVSNPDNEWDTQFFIYTPNKEWESGQKYRISFWYKASAEASCSTQCHGEPGDYKHYAMLPQNPQFTTEWKYYEATSSIPGEGAGMKSIAFNLNVSADAITYYFADIVWEAEESANSIPLTPEEKKDILTLAMGDWVKGMMEACGGYVTAWDVVNEAISGSDAGDGYYGLWSASTVSEADAKNNFYWQDYLGDLDYVRTTIKFAREYFAEFGGNPSALKLFINDYNLESDWDDNKKMKSMAKWVERWEEDGVTKIDGIGTQMHVSYYANAATQKSKEDHVVQMFQLMAATGKLIKISELDMGYVDESGSSVKAADMTEEQHKAMAEYYKFIVEKYFEIIPAAQQYGITHWCITDSPADSGWRAGEPVGLWDLNYNRKPAYAGFADGLVGKNYSE